VGRYELFTISSVVDELSKIARTTSREGKCAKIALQLIEKRRVEILKADGKADETILRLADKRTAVATNDRALRKLLKARGTKTIYIKSKKHLGMD
jgi:rRNA-processing protein FCF1